MVSLGHNEFYVDLKLFLLWYINGTPEQNVFKAHNKKNITTSQGLKNSICPTAVGNNKLLRGKQIPSPRLPEWQVRMQTHQ